MVRIYKFDFGEKMNENPLISVIIPVYNVEQYLDECLNSVINQTYTNLEIILIDDGSTDKSGKICDEFAKRDNRIKVIHQKNKGVSVARNNALDIASGEFITFVDSDDTIEKEHILNMVNLLKDDTDIVCMPLGKGVTTQNIQEFNGIESLRYILQEQYFRELNFAWSNWNKLFKSDVVKNIRYLSDEKVGEDLSFLWKAFLDSKKVVFGNKKTYNYRVSNTSVMQSNFDERHESLTLVCDRFLEYVKNNNIDLLEEAYYTKANKLFELLYRARDVKNIKMVKKYSNELKKIQMRIYANKHLSLKFKFVYFLHANFENLFIFRRNIKEKFKK